MFLVGRVSESGSSTPSPRATGSQASPGGFWSCHKIALLTVSGALVGGAIAAALIATGVGVGLIALPIIAKYVWVIGCGMVIGGLIGLGMGLVTSDLRKVALKQPVAESLIYGKISEDENLVEPSEDLTPQPVSSSPEYEECRDDLSLGSPPLFFPRDACKKPKDWLE